MDMEDELRRVLSEENLDVPVRTGAEWSLMAGARRRRQRHNAFALAGALVAGTMLLSSGIVLVNYPSTEPSSPRMPPVVSDSKHPGRSSDSVVPSAPHGSPGHDWSTGGRDPGDWTDHPDSTTESEDEPTILHDSLTSEPDTSSSEPPTSSSDSETSSAEPSSDIPQSRG